MIGEVASFANDLERTHVSRGKLPFDTESTSAFHWRDAEVDMVFDFKSQITVLAIIVTLLSRLRGFEILTNDFAHFFGFCDQVVAKKLAFTCLRPVERSTALSAIENFEWGLARTRLEAVVVGKLGIWKTIFPLHAKGNDTSPEHIFKDLIDSLDLATCLRMESCAETNVGAHGLLKGFPGLRSEDASMI